MIAVLSYCGKSAPPSGLLPQQFDLTTIEQVVRKVLQEVSEPNTQQSQLKVSGTARPSSELPDDVLGTISDMVDVFRREKQSNENFAANQYWENSEKRALCFNTENTPFV